MAFKKRPEAPKKPTGLADLLDSLAENTASCYVDLMNIPKDAPKIDTGSLAVNLVSGIGGFPVGGLVEVAGEFSSGKTTLALLCAAQVQKNGGVVVFADFEHAFDPYYAQSLGVDIKSPRDGGKLILIQPVNLEDGWNTIQSLVGTGEVTLLVVDSIAAAVPKAVTEGEAGLPRIGLQAALLANEYNKLATRCSKSGCTALLLNQIRTKIEQGRMGSMIVSQDTTGGNALKHYCLMRLWMKIIGKIEDAASDDGEKNFIANKVRFQFIKNKCGRPYTQGILIIRFGHGIDNEFAIMEMAIEQGILEQRSSYFIFNAPEGEIKINGKEATRARLVSDPAFKEAVTSALKEALSKIEP
jgi:recombination protein RecA